MSCTVNVPITDQPKILSDLQGLLTKIAEDHGISLFVFAAKEIEKTPDHTAHMAIGVCKNMTMDLAVSLGETLAEQSPHLGEKVVQGYVLTIAKILSQKTDDETRH